MMLQQQPCQLGLHPTDGACQLFELHILHLCSSLAPLLCVTWSSANHQPPINCSMLPQYCLTSTCCPACTPLFTRCACQAYNHGDHWREHVVASMAQEDRVELEYLQSLPVKYRCAQRRMWRCLLGAGCA
jgi:hypothetical protein